MRRILMVYDKFVPFNVSGTPRVFHFAKDLSSHGYLPSVLTTRVPPGHPRDDAPLADLPSDVEVVRCTPWLKRAKTTPGTGPSASGKGWRARFKKTVGPLGWGLEWYGDFRPPALRTGMRLIEKRGIELIWVSAPHIRNLSPAYALAERTRLPLVVDLRDPWTYGSLWQPRDRLSGAWESAWAARILNRAARVVVTSPLTEVEMQRRFPRVRLTTITNGFSESEVQPKKRTRHLDKCVFRYVGLLNKRRSPRPFLEGVKRACADPEVANALRLEMIGESVGHEGLAKLMGLEKNVFFLPRVTRDASVALMTESDVNVVLQTIDEGTDVISGKTFDYLGAKRPILGVVDPAGGDAWVLDKVPGTKVVSYRDPVAIAEAIRGYVTDFKAQALTELGPGYEHFERKKLAARLARELDAVLSGTG